MTQQAIPFPLRTHVKFFDDAVETEGYITGRCYVDGRWRYDILKLDRSIAAHVSPERILETMAGQWGDSPITNHPIENHPITNGA